MYKFDTKLIENFRRANIILYGETDILIEVILYSTKFKKIVEFQRQTIETMNEGNIEYLWVIYNILCQKHIMKKFSIFSLELHHGIIRDRTEYYNELEVQ